MNNRSPNILFILADQHNYKYLGHTGNKIVKTPNLDKLASEGVSFENAIPQSPICTPSRVSWLSGQYCHNHGYYGLIGPNPEGLPSIPGHFRKYGYKTAAIGKIHCPEYWIEDDCDLFLETCGSGASIVGSKEYEKYLKEKGLSEKEDHIGLQEFGTKGIQSCEGRASLLDFDDSHEGWIVRKANSFMEEASAEDTSFFLHVSLPKPHQCYTPSEPFWSMYDDSDLTLPDNYDYSMLNKPPHLIKVAEYWKSGNWMLFEPKDIYEGSKRKLHGYLGNVTHVDFAVGKLLDQIEKLNISENTIVIYSSDHGEYVCEHGIMEKAPGISSDTVNRIPLIWKWKGKFPEGISVKEIVESVDFAVSICKLAEIPELETSDGKDITELLFGKTKEVHKIAVTELPWSKSVRKGNFRYVFYPKEMFEDIYTDGFGELYDISKDPLEMENLYFNAEYADTVNEIKSDLLDWMVTTLRPKTILPANNSNNLQNHMRFGNSVNSDGKINPEIIRKLNNKNYI